MSIHIQLLSSHTPKFKYPANVIQRKYGTKRSPEMKYSRKNRIIVMNAKIHNIKSHKNATK